MALDVLILDGFGGEEGRQAAPILIPYVNLLETGPVFVLHALDEGVQRGPTRLILELICTHQ